MNFKQKKEDFFLLAMIIVISFFMELRAYSQDAPLIKIKSKNIVFDTVPLNLEEITNSANRIFTGICTRIEEIEQDPKSRNLSVVKYTFKITEKIKGINDKEELTFKVWKQVANGTNYNIGEKYVLFLYPDSRLGFTSSVGYLQGQFQVEKEGQNRGVEFVRNKLNNKGIYRNLKTQRTLSIKNDGALNNYIQTTSEQEQAIRYKDFVRAVRYLIKE